MNRSCEILNRNFQKNSQVHKSPSSLLFFPALVYRGIIALRNLLFDTSIFRSSASPIPVVSIGNITAGGTGKTPMTDLIVNYYLKKGILPAVISRGYKRSTKGVQLVSDGKRVLLNSREAGDETVMLAWKNRAAVVVVAEQRRQGVEFIVKHFQEKTPDVIILDDAFQHRQIQRDLNIVLINASVPFWNDRMLPKGRLREPTKNIGRADLAVITKLRPNETGETLAAPLRKKGIPVIKSRIKTGKLVAIAPVDKTSSAPCDRSRTGFFAVAGIANPDSFLQSLIECGITVSMHTFFDDHEEFPLQELRNIIKKARSHNLAIVTTEKDYYRILGNTEQLALLTQIPSCYLTIEPDIFEGREILESMLDNVLKNRKTIG